MTRTFSKQIADLLYGTIGLTPVEVDVIGTRVFQRLSRVNQLGMAHLVFPGAQYSRLGHSIGVCHVAGAILESLEETDGFDGFSDQEWQRYRLAALLHDVGHYPFSHAFENALEDAYGDEENEQDGDETNEKHYRHEAVGGKILEHDEELRGVLEDHGFDPKNVSAIFQRKNTRPGAFTYADVLSSGLDADRLDYLRRTAHHTGVPYGSIDGDYLISQFCLVDDTVALTHRARLTADHFLLSRWFEYQQVIFHHTVQAADTTLEDVLKALFKRNNDFAFTREDVDQKIRSGTWADFDDVRMMEAIRRLKEETNDADDENEQAIHDKCRALLERRLPKTVYECSRFLDSRVAESNEKGQPLGDDALKNLARKYNIHHAHWKLWTKGSPLTKMKGEEVRNEEADKEEKHNIHIRPKHVHTSVHGGGAKPTRLVDDVQSLISRLADDERYTWRLYVLFPHHWDEERVNNTREDIRNDLIENHLTEA